LIADVIRCRSECYTGTQLLVGFTCLVVGASGCGRREASDGYAAAASEFTRPPPCRPRQEVVVPPLFHKVVRSCAKRLLQAIARATSRNVGGMDETHLKCKESAHRSAQMVKEAPLGAKLKAVVKDGLSSINKWPRRPNIPVA
jgi:hypothetical protein